MKGQNIESIEELANKVLEKREISEGKKEDKVGRGIYSLYNEKMDRIFKEICKI